MLSTKRWRGTLTSIPPRLAVANQRKATRYGLLVDRRGVIFCTSVGPAGLSAVSTKLLVSHVETCPYPVSYHVYVWSLLVVAYVDPGNYQADIQV
jgi:hypothetical protein